jgi:prepilin signal peptidase PulO-like enzyme (type II secretory pathway)
LLLFALISGLHLYFEPNPDGLWVAGIILIIFSGCQLFFSLFLRKLAMGWGDMILGPACGVWIYAHELPYFLLSTGFIGLIMGLFWYYRWGNRTYPFMPSILGGLGVILLIRCFLKSDGL